MCDVGYDVVRGDLQTLLTGNGNFTTATEECLADNHTLTSLDYSGAPTGAGSGYWFLARRIGDAGNGSYDSEGGSQHGSRDAGVAASGADYP